MRGSLSSVQQNRSRPMARLDLKHICGDRRELSGQRDLRAAIGIAASSRRAADARIITTLMSVLLYGSATPARSDTVRRHQ
jgi:hypothetical protein